MKSSSVSESPSESPSESVPPPPPKVRRRPRPGASRSDATKDRYWLHALLFVLTLASTIYVGGWVWSGRYLYYQEAGPTAQLIDGLRYAVPFLLFLTVHEFGHYFAARRHHIRTSLPYYIPFPLNGIGTFGAVIRIREPIPSTRKLFDVGASGPIAGFVVALAALLYAMGTLPPPEYLLDLPGHEALKAYIVEHGRFPDHMLEVSPSANTMVVVVGETPLYWGLSKLFPHVPPMYEMMHYPTLFASWFGLLFTALNLLPVGQLDGGHILYALFGRTWQSWLARGFVVVLLISGSIGFVEDTVPWFYAQSEAIGALSWFVLAGILYFYLGRVFNGRHRLIAPALGAIMMVAVGAEVIGEPVTRFGYTGWFFWCLLIVFLIKVDHPPVTRDEPLTPRRRLLGYLAIAIFVLCFSLRPLYVA